jgi:hypothetical protein
VEELMGGEGWARAMLDEEERAEPEGATETDDVLWSCSLEPVSVCPFLNMFNNEYFVPSFRFDPLRLNDVASGSAPFPAERGRRGPLVANDALRLTAGVVG